jgi:hypothetical protein
MKCRWASLLNGNLNFPINQIKPSPQSLNLSGAFGIHHLAFFIKQGKFSIVLQRPTGQDCRCLHRYPIEGFNREQHNAIEDSHYCFSFESNQPNPSTRLFPSIPPADKIKTWLNPGFHFGRVPINSANLINLSTSVPVQIKIQLLFMGI